MAEEGADQEQKTEHPTGKRLGEARDQGNLPISREVSAWVTILAILVVIAWIGPGMMSDLLMAMRGFLESPDQISINDKGLQTVVLGAIGHVAMSSGLVFLVLAAGAIFGIVSQTGLYASWSLIKPDFTKLNFVGGIKKIFSANSAIELLKSVGKLIFLGIAAYFTLRPLIDDMPNFTGQPMMATLTYLHHQVVRLTIILLIVFSAVAIGDLAWQRYSYIKNLRMTKAEVKDEYRQQEGDPIIKSRLRQIRFEKARKRMMARVPKADVVITNPTHYAVALQYDNDRMGAPVVTAKGVDRLALRIRELAEESKVPIVSNPPLARSLHDSVDIDEEIPAQHYRTVAEIISYVYKLKKRGF